ncbi:MAG: hypothetical protein A2Y97_09030 [Nitrospirae bacterium RBG_13_39_12]|nr:MAG: hypothetical protein A2Y97_09030 [Nitrospirae bacterium RBG_13_39_12]
MDAAKAVTATFTLKTYTITASAGTGGTISPASRTVNHGSTTTFTVTPNAGYTATMGGTCGGSLSGTTYTTNAITANCTVTATFTANPVNGVCGTSSGGTFTTAPTTNLCSAGTATGVSGSGPWTWSCTGSNGGSTANCSANIQTRTVSASAGTGGSISPSGSVIVNYGANQTFTITPNANYSVANVVADGSSVGAVTTYTFTNVTANHTISASFTTNTYTLSATKAGTGSITSSPAGISCGSVCSYAYNSGTSVTLTATPDTSATFGGWSGVCFGTGTCTVTMDAAKTVTATFTLKTYTITASAGSGGTITPSGTVTVNYGATQAFTITADTGYSLTDVKVDNVSQGALSGYTFTNVTNNHSIEAIFAMDSETGSVDLPRTGQTISYATGDDGYIQAGIEWPSSRFTNNGDGTVTDNLTGLMWLRDGGCIKKSWSYAFSAITDFNNKQGNYICQDYTANYSDWRLPNVKELESLINYGASNSSTWLNSVGFANVKSSTYWSSTTDKGYISKAWSVMMSDGMETSNRKSNAYYIVPVRTGTSGNPYELQMTGQTASYASGDDGYIQAGNDWPNPRFTNNGDGTVTDNLTGLIWLKDGGCIKKSWSYAISAIADFNINPGKYICIEYTANYSDWRLPNIKELESLINYESSNSATFANVNPSYYWSSTTYNRNTASAWVINMTKADKRYIRKNYSYYLWPVRGGNIQGN